MLLAFQLPPWIDNHLPWWIAGLIVAGGLLVLGLRDLLRFSPARAGAIARVCFIEAMRKKVWLIVPLAMLGVIVVSQLQNPIDEQDAIRQTVKYALFATGLVATITSIILACTNLPREIESRVIYTVVTKPTTRLEVIVGKVFGLASVSALILALMGICSLVYLNMRAWRFQSEMRSALETGAVDPSRVASIRHYVEHGLLNARDYRAAGLFQILAREAALDEPTRSMFGDGEGEVLVPFLVTRELLTPGASTGLPQEPCAGGFAIQLNMGFRESNFLAGPSEATPAVPDLIANPSGAAPSARADRPAVVVVQVLDANANTLIPSHEIDDGKSPALPDPTGKTDLVIPVSPAAATRLFSRPELERVPIFVHVTGTSAYHEYVVGPEPVRLLVPGREPINAVIDERTGKPAAPIFRTRMGNNGQQLRGDRERPAPIAHYHFRGLGPTEASATVPFEFRAAVERSSDQVEDEELTDVRVTFINRTTGFRSEPIRIAPEASRTVHFVAPAEAVAGGDFDVLLQCRTTGHFVGLNPASLLFVKSEHAFTWNLFKSLLVMWLMTLLVIIVSVFCSTFLSWPIAIVLTLVILLGRWAVVQLGDATQPGIGNLVATDLGFRDPSQALAVSRSIEALSKGLNLIAAVLPDISQFASIEDIERGATVPMFRLRDSGRVLLLFGLPMVVLAYVFLRNKEVAP
jgi:ABC-type transport system involved in multi-copper enzyme maturation permease subunit